MPGQVERWCRDPLLARLYAAIRRSGPIRSISVDLTDACDLRCAGCYFFAEGMDRGARGGDAELQALIDRERARGTNFVTVVGGEPSLVLDRLRRLYAAFRLSVATNGQRRIPYEGFEDLPIGVSVWGDHATDRRLRGGDRTDVFGRALDNYRGDGRAFWYYTVAPGHADEVERVVDRCVANGNRVLFNFYGDLAQLGGALDHRRGFDRTRRAIEAAIDRHPSHVLMTAALAEVVATGTLFGESWGHATCTSITADHPTNRERVRNGKPFSRHFRAYNADFRTTRRCCTGIDRGCDSCFDTWQHFSWVMLNARKHLGNERDFSRWLTTTYLFYFINRLVDVAEGAALLPEIHRRCRAVPPALASDSAPSASAPGAPSAQAAPAPPPAPPRAAALAASERRS